MNPDRRRAYLSWHDHDSSSKDRTKRILALFNERESRDELGLGAIRDSFSDILFPGTSTIHTRLRYMLIIPWVFQYIEAQGVSSREFPIRVDQLERELINVLHTSASDEEWGLFGGSVGSSLKRLPSEVYWGALGWWKIRLHPVSITRYGQELDAVRAYRKRLGQQTGQDSDDRGDTEFSRSHMWHAGLPAPPSEFPDVLDIRMRREESQYIQERLKSTHSECLLTHLARHCDPSDVEYPWMHPEYASFTKMIIPGFLSRPGSSLR